MQGWRFGPRRGFYYSIHYSNHCTTWPNSYLEGLHTDKDWEKVLAWGEQKRLYLAGGIWDEPGRSNRLSTEQKRGKGMGDSVGKQKSYLRGLEWPAGWSSRFLWKTGGKNVEMVEKCHTMGGLGYATKSLDFFRKAVGGLLQDLSPGMTWLAWYFRKFYKGV